MLAAFGFSDKWITWIRACVESAHANVLVNGSPSGDFELKRGLRQGDPISPFLFILAAECIGLLMKRAIQRGFFDPMEVGAENSIVSHIQFADDTIFIGRASIKNALLLKRLLILVELVSGLRINRTKCQVINLKANPGMLTDIADLLGCKWDDPPFKYLGLNLGCRHNKVRDWFYVIEKVRNRLDKWRNLKISLGGRITLVKFVLSTVPLYALSVFKASVKVLNILTSLLQGFIWGGGDRNKKIVWAKWDFLAQPKEEGGLGVKDLGSFNKALLGKWAWRALGGEESLWVETVLGNYKDRGRGGSGFQIICSSRRVRGWWGDVLVCLRDSGGAWFESNLVREVGNGEGTLFWNDVWVGDAPLRSRFPRLFQLCLDQECSVARAGRWEGESWVWGFEWRRELREWERTDLTSLVDLMRCRSSASMTMDRWVWKPEESGAYSVRSGYDCMMSRKNPTRDRASRSFKLMWASAAVPKAQTVAWRVLCGKIATRKELQRRGVKLLPSASMCALCGSVEETVSHLFFECRCVWELWAICLDWIGVATPISMQATENIVHFCNLGRGKVSRKILVTIWVCVVWLIWNKRNEVVFEEGEWCKDKVLDAVKSFVWSWMKGLYADQATRLNFRSWSYNPQLHR